MMRTTIICTALLALLSPSAPKARAGLIISETYSSWTDQDHIDFAVGQPVTQFYINAIDSLGNVSSGRGSGYLITDGTSLAIRTAAHVLDTTFLSGDFYSSFQVGTGSNFNTNPGSIYNVTDYYVHPDYTAIGSDTALLFIDFASVAEPLLPAQMYFGNPADLIGGTMVLSGYGMTGNTDVGYTGTDGNIRAGENRIDSYFPDREGGILTSILRTPSSSIFRESAILGGPGDSGGLALLNGTYGLGVIDGGSGNGFLGLNRISLSDTAWELSVFQSRTVPEPSSLALASLGSLLGVFHRRRRKLAATGCYAWPTACC